MTEHDAREDLQVIKAMLEKTKKTTAESGTLFIVWGLLISLALIGNFVLSSLKLYHWEWLNWVAMAVVGWVVTVIFSIRKRRSEKVTTYFQIAARHLYFSCGIGFLLVGLIFPAIGVYSYEAITVLIAAISGILFFALAGVFEWPPFRGLGIFWWLGAVGLSFAEGNLQMLLYTGLFIAGFLVPALLLRAKYRRDQGR